MSPGTYTWYLTVTSAVGATDTTSGSVTIDSMDIPLYRSTDESMAVFFNDGKLQTCTDFLSSHTWTTTSLATTRSKKFTPDYASAFFNGGGQLDGWIIGGNTNAFPPKIYHVTDVFGTPVATEVFSVASTGGGFSDICSTPGYPPIAIGFWQNNASHIELVPFTATTSDGITWTRNDLESSMQSTYTDGAGTHFPFVITRSINDGTVYIIYGIQLHAGGTVITPNGIHASTDGDGGAAFGNTVLESLSDDGAMIRLPYSDESEFYVTDGNVLKKGGSDISPSYGGVAHSCGQAGLAILPTNSDTIAVAGIAQTAGAARHAFISTTGGASWTVLGVDADYSSRAYVGVLMAGDDPTQLLLIGQDSTNHALLCRVTGTTMGTPVGGLNSGSLVAATIVGVVGGP